MFSVQYSTNGVARRVSLDSYRLGRIMILQNRLGEQKPHSLWKAFWQSGFQSKEASLVHNFVKDKAVLANRGEIVGRSSQTPGTTGASSRYSRLASSWQQWACLGKVQRRLKKLYVPKLNGFVVELAFRQPWMHLVVFQDCQHLYKVIRVSVLLRSCWRSVCHEVNRKEA
jgi:hypothetical protein